MRITGGDLRKQRFLFLGAGEAGVGIANLIVSTLVDLGVDGEEAKRACWLVDSHGLVVKSRHDLAEHKKMYAHDAPASPDLSSAVKTLKPTALIGVSGKPSTFTREVLQAMAAANERPIIFALSNPTANSECTAEEAYVHTGGRALYASGSPFPAVDYEGKRYIPAQANNAYVFPGVALGVIASRAQHVTDEMFAAAARTLADLVTREGLSNGVLFPPLSTIREVSVKIASAVARVAIERGLSDIPANQAERVEEIIREQVFEPVYERLRVAMVTGSARDGEPRGPVTLPVPPTRRVICRAPRSCTSRAKSVARLVKSHFARHDPPPVPGTHSRRGEESREKARRGRPIAVRRVECSGGQPIRGASAQLSRQRACHRDGLDRRGGQCRPVHGLLQPRQRRRAAPRLRAGGVVGLCRFVVRRPLVPRRQRWGIEGARRRAAHAGPRRQSPPLEFRGKRRHRHGRELARQTHHLRRSTVARGRCRFRAGRARRTARRCRGHAVVGRLSTSVGRVRFKGKAFRDRRRRGRRACDAPIRVGLECRPGAGTGLHGHRLGHQVADLR